MLGAIAHREHAGICGVVPGSAQVRQGNLGNHRQRQQRRYGVRTSRRSYVPGLHIRGEEGRHGCDLRRDTGFNCTFDVRYLWMHQKRLQGSHFAHLKQASAANKLMVERRLDPCMSEVFPWADMPAAHMKMLRNEHKPGNMAVLVQSPRTGLRTLEDTLDTDVSI